MKSLMLTFVFAMALVNAYFWLVWPEFLHTVMWKFDIFMTLVFAPLFWLAARVQR
jgi:hypothetical protein